MPVCPTCEKTFCYKSNQKFCSIKCKSTYHNRTKRGLPLQGYLSPYNGPPEQRFWLKVNKNGPVSEHYPEIGNCWEWIGRKDGTYGSIIVNKKEIKAHRYSYQIHKGIIPEGYEICHKCDNPLCVNPDHLWADTHQNNMIDAFNKGRLASINFNIINGTNLQLLSDIQLTQAIKNLAAEQEQRKEQSVPDLV